MKRYYIILIVSLFLIGLTVYQFWSIQQPRIGPVGDGSISRFVYIPIILGFIVGVSWFVKSIYLIIKSRKK